jgi:hypothetical protein
MRSKTPAQLHSFRLHTYLLPKASPSLKRTSTRRTNGHCLGTFMTREKMFARPKYSVSHYLPPLSWSPVHNRVK